MDTKLARSIMRGLDVALKPGVTLDRVSDHLTKYHLPGAPVIDASGALVGYVSEYDCLQQLMQSSYYCDNAALVEDVMSTKLITQPPTISIMDLASKMNADRINVMPIVEEGKLIGAVSRGDVMRALVKDMEECKVPV
ncbi:CBS domain-containing protein [Arenicella sp. 4NH20-0111]|uniref:CBS domain-containing protein n=1 Tax=Arenicella sp. 4NH20-0111 TaxID=3127648 RepID=UPI0031093F89